MAASTGIVHHLLLKLLHLLYEKDILGEDIILKWYNSGEESSTAAAVRKQVMPTGCTIKGWTQTENAFPLQYLFPVCPLSVMRHVFR
jgi:hypothetical protein